MTKYLAGALESCNDQRHATLSPSLIRLGRLAQSAPADGHRLSHRGESCTQAVTGRAATSIHRRTADTPGCQSHADWAMIRKVYGRWIPEADPMAGHEITALLEGESCDQPRQTTPNKKKAPPSGKALSDRGLDGLERSAQADEIGGGGGNRTRVRKSSAVGSTCLARSLHLTGCYPTGREGRQRFR